MTLPIPSLPTDSLYKFGFAGCIIIHIAIFYFIDRQIENLIPAYNQNFSKIEAGLNDGFDRYYNSSSQLRSIMANDSLGEYAEDTLSELLVNLKRIHAYNSRTVDYLDELRKNEIRNHSVKIEQTTRRVNMLNCFSWINFVMLVLFGSAWFYRAQIPNDRLLEIELELAKEKLEKFKSGIESSEENPPNP